MLATRPARVPAAALVGRLTWDIHTGVPRIVYLAMLGMVVGVSKELASIIHWLQISPGVERDLLKMPSTSFTFSNPRKQSLDANLMVRIHSSLHSPQGNILNLLSNVHTTPLNRSSAAQDSCYHRECKPNKPNWYSCCQVFYLKSWPHSLPPLKLEESYEDIRNSPIIQKLWYLNWLRNISMDTGFGINNVIGFLVLTPFRTAGKTVRN